MNNDVFGNILQSKKKTGEKDEYVGAMLSLLFIFPYLPLAALLRSFVIMSLWNWFLVPAGLSSIGLVVAFGISIFYTVLSGPPSNADAEAKQREFEKYGRGAGMVHTMIDSTFIPITCLIFGYIAQLFL